MSCKYKEYLKDKEGKTLKVPQCRVTCGECQFLSGDFDVKCEIYNAAKDIYK